VVDGGDVYGDFLATGLEAKVRAEIATEAMALMGYQAFNLADRDFAFGLPFALDYPKQFHLPTLSANIRYADSDELVTLPYRIVEYDQFQVGLIGVTAKANESGILEANLNHTRPIEVTAEKAALQATLDLFRRQVDLVVVLAHVELANVATLIDGLDHIDLVIAGHGYEQSEELSQENGVYIFKPGYYGKYLGKIDILFDKAKGITQANGSLVEISQVIPEDEAVKAIVDQFASRVQAHKDVLLNTPQETPSSGGKYVGAATCQGCHASQYAQWAKTQHAAAFQPLVYQNQDYSAECLACHATGFGYTGGFQTMEVTPETSAVQCETCHGAGGDHLLDPTSPMLPGSDSSICQQCHTTTTSPEFQYDQYLPYIAH
jgi:2',3'-cyclic-nucleotide 2'-phosphodiesterase (5'-nucleotidase family)